ncbi:MAG: DNA recombination protein RmuC [Clostridia bacterium]
MDFINYITLAISVASLIIVLIILLKPKVDKSTENSKRILASAERDKKDVLDFIQRQLETQNSNQAIAKKQLSDAENSRFNDFSENTQRNINVLRQTVSEMLLTVDKRFENLQKSTDNQLVQIRDTVEKKVSAMQENNEKNLAETREIMDKRLLNLQKTNEEQLREVRDTLEKKVNSMQESNEKKLDQMRETVDEKLQKTLEERISKSFKLVSERLEEVYKSLGEMQKLATGVDDLKKVLSNVKTRGILGEVQLGAILEEILNTDQYDTNIATKKGSSDRVEFAVKLPGNDGDFVYLPIDAKFPMDAYQNLLTAYDSGVSANVDAAAKVLTTRIKSFAKDIKNKYIDVPHTTEFGIMFLPLEGLYAEVVRRGMVEELQKDKINIAGPTTMAALLNSLQMGFRTLAIQKRSSEVWSVLEGVKQEFAKFEDALTKTQMRMRQASDELDKLVVTRTNAINRKLKNVASLEAPKSEEE